MSANQVQDWLQIGAGVCGILGLIFLATGIIEEKRDAQVIAPLLLAVGAAILLGSGGYYYFGVVIPFDSLTRTLLITVSVLSGVVLGYWLGSYIVRREAARVPSGQIRRRSIWVRLGNTAVVFLGGIAGIVTILDAVGLSYHRPAEEIVTVAGVATVLIMIFYGSEIALLYIKPPGLRIIGLLLSTLSILLAISPAIADLVGFSIK